MDGNDTELFYPYKWNVLYTPIVKGESRRTKSKEDLHKENDCKQILLVTMMDKEKEKAIVCACLCVKCTKNWDTLDYYPHRANACYFITPILIVIVSS